MATARSFTLPAPIGGWNARDPLSAMKPTHAVQLDNFIPGTGGVAIRNGHSVHATGLGAAVESLMEHRGPSGGLTLFGAAGTSVFNVTSAGAVGAAALTGMGNARFQHTMFANTAGNYLYIVNGSVAPRHYDGTNWATPSITGATAANFIHVASHAKRLWFVEKNSLKAWYLPVDAIAGAVTGFDLGPHCARGGSLLAIATWTRDGGSGADDVMVFLTDTGEAVLYSGTDPATAASWVQVGKFQIPQPIGRRCFMKFGADLAIITSQGLIPMSAVLSAPSSDVKERAITDLISGAFTDAYKAFGALFGWQVSEYAKDGLLLVNVPRSDGTTSVQFVMNALTGAWCRFTGINAICMSLLGDALYFGKSNGSVYKYSSDFLDVAAGVSGIIFPAFSNFRTAARKLFKMAKPLLTAVTGTVPPVSLRTDYDTTPPNESVPSVPSSGSPWDTSLWDVSSWGAPIESILEWQTVFGEGFVASIALNVTSETAFTLNQIDVLYERGNVM